MRKESLSRRRKYLTVRFMTIFAVGCQICNWCVDVSKLSDIQVLGARKELLPFISILDRSSNHTAILTPAPFTSGKSFLYFLVHLVDVYNCAKGHLPKCIFNDFMAVGLIQPPPNTRLHQKPQYE